MGNCISSASKHKSSNMSFDWAISSRSESIFVESPIKEATVERSLDAPSSTPSIRSYGELSGDNDMFFDSQLWLDSDCEDYFSVCDDSSVNTPVHPSSFTKQSELDNPLFMETAPDPVSAESAIEVKKQLFELFNESFRIDHVERETKCGIIELPATSPVKTPSYNTNSAKVKLKSSASSPHCCFPGLVRSLSLGEKKKTM